MFAAAPQLRGRVSRPLEFSDHVEREVDAILRATVRQTTLRLPPHPFVGVEFRRVRRFESGRRLQIGCIHARAVARVGVRFSGRDPAELALDRVIGARARCPAADPVGPLRLLGRESRGRSRSEVQSLVSGECHHRTSYVMTSAAHELR